MPSINTKQVEFIDQHLGIHLPDAVVLQAKINTTEQWENLSDAEILEKDMTPGDLKAIFSREKMLELTERDFTVEDQPGLKKVMLQIESGKFEKSRFDTMIALATHVGIPPTAEQLDADYGRFLVIRRQQELNEEINVQEAKAKGDDPGEAVVPELDNDKFPDFMASEGQLMFGAVLGEAFDIHEVFAALLSSTGGLVGPGNSALQLSPQNPISLHGTVHDAAGYLLNNHDEGPGYNYRESSAEILFDTDDPLAGQMSGVHFWVNEVSNNDNFDEHFAEVTDATMLMLEGGLENARDAVAEDIDDMLADYESAKKKASRFTDWIPDPISDVAEAIGDTAVYTAASVADGAATVATQAVGVAANTVGATAKVAVEVGTLASKLDDAVEDVVDIGVDAATDLGKTAFKTTANVTGEALETAADVTGAVAETVTDVGEATFGAVKDVTKTVAKTAIDMVTATNPVDAGGAVIDGVVDVTETVATAAVDVTKEVAEGVLDVGESVANGVVDIAEDVGGAVVDIADAAGEAASDLAKVAVDTVEDVTEAVVDIAEAVDGAFSRFFEAATETFSSDTKTTKLPDKVQSKFDALASFIWD